MLTGSGQRQARETRARWRTDEEQVINEESDFKQATWLRALLTISHQVKGASSPASYFFSVAHHLPLESSQTIPVHLLFGDMVSPNMTAIVTAIG